jgi:hypothetical protein
MVARTAIHLGRASSNDNARRHLAFPPADLQHTTGAARYDLNDAVCVASVPRRRRGRGYHAHWNQRHAGLPLPTQLGDPPLQRRQRDAASLREALLRQLASLELGNCRDPELTSATHRTGEDRLRAREPPCVLARTDTSRRSIWTASRGRLLSSSR